MSLLRRQFLSLLASTSSLAMSTANAGSPEPEMPHVPWSRQAAIYEINVRQFTAEGTLKAATADLPRLKVKWVFAYPGNIADSQPTIAGHMLFVANHAGRVFARRQVARAAH